jgi:hypothetical protein
MQNIATYRVELLKTDILIALAEERVATQTLLVAQMHADGCDTAEADTLLTIMQDALCACRRHRQLMLLALNEPE